jgi:hypothetical protein
MFERRGKHSNHWEGRTVRADAGLNHSKQTRVVLLKLCSVVYFCVIHRVNRIVINVYSRGGQLSASGAAITRQQSSARVSRLACCFKLLSACYLRREL